MQAESLRLGWPVGAPAEKAEELAVDKELLLLFMGVTSEFGWCLRETGTHVFMPVDEVVHHWGERIPRSVRNYAIDLAQTVARAYPEALFYWWDGAGLAPLPIGQLVLRLRR